jgi:signal transduction histidine kinase
MAQLRDAMNVQDETQRRGQAFLHALPIMLIPLFVGVALGLFLRAVVGVNPDVTDDAPRGNPLLPVLVIAVFFIALIALVRFGRPNLSSVIFIGAWTLFTTLFGLVSGVTGIWAALLIVPICAAGLLLDGVASISLAALATLLIVALAILEWQGILTPRLVIPEFLAPYAPVLGAGFWVGIFWTIAALTYLLANNLQNALKQSRAQAEQLREFSNELEERVQAQTAVLVEQSREAAVMEERARVARDIHDTLAQGLTGIVVQLGAAQRAMEVAPQDAPEHLKLAQDMAREALAEARRSIWNLRAPNLERGELRDALAGLAQRASTDKTQVRFQGRGDEWELRAEVESALLRVAQEALVNVGKHARATQADVTLEYLPDAVRLVIQDNGVGLNVEQPANGPTSGFGVIGMRERIAQWGGELVILNDEGTRVQATIPRARAERESKTFGVSETPKVYDSK